ncbi:hypothetical protein LSAT2_010648 [Lamellibrachia satsuma]|nr:hypothetical protein LSAT2_010648 [Lamellibrachia satsuma]
MSLEKVFKWSEKDYSMKEFVDIFSRRLPLIIFITEGWQGRDEDHTFSGDEVYRIAAVKRQRRIVAKHGSGYFVSIPTTINKKVDLFFPDGEVQRSASLEELVAALQIHDDGSLQMMFENDEKVSFSFGPDEADEINFGKMKVIDVYDERYLVGHSVWHGQVYCSKLPRPIPVYMTLQVAPAVGVIGGTEEDFRKILADIEEQMIGGTTEVEDYDEIMLFPHDITGSDYEYIRPCDWAPGILSGASCKIDVPEMTSSPAYPLVGRPSPAELPRQARDVGRTTTVNRRQTTTRPTAATSAEPRKLSSCFRHTPLSNPLSNLLSNPSKRC